MRLQLKNGKLVDAGGQTVGTVKLTIDLEEPKPKPEQSQLPVGADPIPQVWEHYVKLMKPRKQELTADARDVIRIAMKVATAEECCEAITGCFKSDFHMRRGEFATRPGPKYNALSQILKGRRGGRTTREQIDFFIDIATRNPEEVVDPSASSVRIRDAKQDVLAAHEFPDDEHAATRGSEGRKWLSEQGWTIGAREDGWPTFTPPPGQSP
jgi:hypothetical protein